MIDIIHSLVLGLTQLFTFDTFGLMMLGISIGFFVGILPGMGGPTALALMLPFIVTMTPVQAFAFLLGMSSVTSTTGDITSVLIGIPGEPTTAATIVDGHPMAKKGEAGRALGAVLMSSLVGAIFGSVALAVAIPVIRPLVLSFKSPEFFMLSVLGITFVAALSGENMLKGLISGGIGLLVSTVPGGVVLLGFLVCLVGIALCGYAGVLKERMLTEEQKKESIKDFALGKGLTVAVFGGIMSASMSLAFTAGRSIAVESVKAGTAEVFKNMPLLVVALAGGFTTNFISTMILTAKSKSFGDYVVRPPRTLFLNYFLAAISGVLWYGQWFS